MGHQYLAKCKKCGFKFEVQEGGGFFFHLLRCDSCGITKSISFKDIGEPHLQYLKGLPGHYCSASAEHDKYIKDNYPGKPVTEEEYHEIVEKMAGKCKCGGQYKFDALARCPKCKSTEIEDTGVMMTYYD